MTLSNLTRVYIQKTFTLLMVMLSISYVSFSQQYKITIQSNGSYESGSYESAAGLAELDGYSSLVSNSGGVMIVVGKPTSIQVYDAYDEWEEYTGNTISQCNNSYSFGISLGDCDSYSGYLGGACWGGQFLFSFTIEPVFGGTTTSPAPSSSISYCPGQKISLSGTSGFSSYTWQYKTASSGSFQTFATSGASIDFDITSSLGSNYSSYLGQGITFRYFIGNCDPGSSSNGTEIGPFFFAPPPIKIDVSKISKTDISCSGKGDGVLTLTSASYSRALLPGESISTTSLYTSQNLSSLVTQANGTTVSGIGPNSYFILVESNITPCGGAVFSDNAITFTNPSPFTASAAATATHNGTVISCVSASDGVVTVSASGGTLYSKDNWATSQTSSVFAGLSAGINYTFYAKNTNSCMATTNTVKLTDPAAVVFTSATPYYVSSVLDYNGRDVSCQGKSDGKITVSAGGGSGSLHYSVDNSTYQTSNVLTGLGPNDYTVYVKDDNSCLIASPVTVTVHDTPVLTGSTLLTVNPTCNTSVDGSITIANTSGGTTPYTYSKDNVTFQSGANNNVFGSLSATATGTPYTVYVKDVNGCSMNVGTTLTSPAAIVVSGTPQLATCVGRSDGAITATVVSGGVSPFLYTVADDPTVLPSPYQSSNVLTGLSKKLYTVTVKDAHQCTGSIPVYVDEKQLTGSIAITNMINCNGDQTGALALSVSGGTPGYSFLWNDASSATTQTVSGLGAGSYSVDVTDGTGCTATYSKVISQPNLLQVSLSKQNYHGFDTSCSGVSDGVITTTVTGGTTGYTYLWSTGSVQPSIGGLPGGSTYGMTVTDANQCVANGTASIISPDPVSVSVASLTEVTCQGYNNGTITLQGQGGTSVYQYSLDGMNWQTGNEFSNLSPQGYTLLLKDENNCTTQTTATITEPEKLLITMGTITDTKCGQNNGAAAIGVAGGSVPYSYAWMNVQSQVVSTDANLAQVPGGAYTIVVTDKNNCTDTNVALVSSSDGPQVVFSNLVATSCSYSSDGGATITITSGLGPFAVNWNSGETSLQAQQLKGGNDYVTVTDANDCTIAEPVTIASPLVLTMSSPQITPISCHGSTDGQITVVGTGGTGPYVYQWDQSVASATLTNAGAGSYGVTITDAHQCIYKTSIAVADVAAVGATLQQSTLPTCFGGGDGSMTIAGTGGNGGYGYSWNTGSTNATVSNITSGSYTVVVTDVKSCAGTVVFQLDDPVKFVVDLGPDQTVCVGQKETLTAGVDNATCVWSGDNGFSATTESVVIDQAGTYRVDVTNALGCKASDTFVLTTSTGLLKSDFLMAAEAVAGDTVVLIDISWPLPDGVTWSFPAGSTVVNKTSDYSELVFGEAGSYNVTLTAHLGDCVDSDTKTITIDGSAGTTANSRESTTNKSMIEIFSAYPNPHGGEFKVEVSLSEVQEVNIMLVNAGGNAVVFDYTKDGSDRYDWEVRVPELTQGTYFLVLKVGKETKAIRVVKI